MSASEIPSKNSSDSPPKEGPDAKHPIVSVHMITYNHAPYIRQAIESVLRQECDFSLELVLGEDCSRDGTREIVFEYQHRFPDIVRVVTSDENVGAKKNMYRTVKACRGKYIAFCDGDDYWHNPYKLQKQVDYLEHHPECGFVYSEFDVLRRRTNRKITNYNRHVFGPAFKPSTEIAEIVEGRGGIIHTCTVVARKHLVETVMDSDAYLYQDDSVMMGDHQLWAEMSARAKVHFIQDSLATRCLLEDSATQNKDGMRNLRFYISLMEVNRYLCDKYKLPEHIRANAEAMRSRHMLRLAILEGNAALANEAKNGRKKLSFKEWLLYLGGVNSLAHRPFKGAYSIYRRVHKGI